MYVDYALADRKINEVNINVMWDRKKSSKECSNPFPCPQITDLYPSMYSII
jgi:hypothetical protein